MRAVRETDPNILLQLRNLKKKWANLVLFTFGTDDKTETAAAISHRLQKNTDDRGKEQRERDIESC